MILALLISNFCLVILAKGVPTWLETILGFLYGASSFIALLLWDETKRKINTVPKEKGSVE